MSTKLVWAIRSILFVARSEQGKYREGDVGVHVEERQTNRKRQMTTFARRVFNGSMRCGIRTICESKLLVFQVLTVVNAWKCLIFQLFGVTSLLSLSLRNEYPPSFMGSTRGCAPRSALTSAYSDRHRQLVGDAYPGA